MRLIFIRTNKRNHVGQQKFVRIKKLNIKCSIKDYETIKINDCNGFVFILKI
jgi:hypothetical protein